MKRLACPNPDCEEQIKISPINGIFSYNIKCNNGHQYDYVNIDDLLINKKIFSNICNIHKKKNIILCSDCEKSVCAICYKEKHNTHKIEYLKPINDYEKEIFKDELSKYKNSMNDFILGLINFKKEIENYINNLISLLKKKYDLTNELLNNLLENNYTYFDKRNVYENFRENVFDKFSKDFLKSKYFLEKYNLMGKIFEKIINENKNDNKLIKEINKNNEIYKNKGIITMKYKKNDKKIRILGHDFAKTNKSQCKIIYHYNYYDLTEYFKIDRTNNKELLEIKLAGINNIYYMEYMFSDCFSLVYIENLDKFNTSKIYNMSNLFNNCSSLISLSDISKWNTSNVNNMSYMFSGCTSLVSLPDISKWNTSNVNDMSFMFSRCICLTTFPEITKWNISKLMNMNNIFYGCLSLTYIPDIFKGDYSQVKNINDVFVGCINFPKIFRAYNVYNTNDYYDHLLYLQYNMGIFDYIFE